MKKFLLSLITIFLMLFILMATVQRTTAKPHQIPTEDTILYMPLIMKNYTPGPGNLTGIVFDAQTNNPISATDVCLSRSLEASSFLCVGNDNQGVYLIENVYTGWYYLSAQETTGLGYLPFTQQVFIPAFNTATMNIPLSRPLGTGQYRIVLSWSNQTSPQIDLDANLWLPPTPPYHYRITRYAGTAPADDGSGQNNTAGTGNINQLPYAFLDIDSQDGSGPETISIDTHLASTTQGIYGEYTYVVYNFSRAAILGELPFTALNIRVDVYGPTGLITTFTPPAGDDHLLWWNVFRIGDDGHIVPVNEYTNECPSPYPDTEPGNADTLCP